MEESARRRAPVVQLANRLAGWFVGVVLAWPRQPRCSGIRATPTAAIDNAIALLIVTCPCALALATPLAVSMAIGRAARNGILIKGGDAIERLAEPGVLLLDKTGTITEARVALEAWAGPEWAKPLVLALEQESSHPIADGFRRAFAGVDALPASLTTHVVGGGIEGMVDGRHVVVGSPAFVEARATRTIAAPPCAPTLTPVLVAVDGIIVASASFGDPIRSDARASIDALVARGWRVGILSGDHPQVVATVGQCARASTGVVRGRRRAGREAPRRGRDAPPGYGGDGRRRRERRGGDRGGGRGRRRTRWRGSVSGDGGRLPRPTRSRHHSSGSPKGAARTMAIIRRNIAFSIGYNIIGATLAVTGTITPLVAAVLMPLSSLTVVLASWSSTSFARERES